jgi:hypothetical protein
MGESFWVEGEEGGGSLSLSSLYFKSTKELKSRPTSVNEKSSLE